MKMKRVVMGILLGVGILGFASFSRAQEFKPYTADVIQSSNGETRSTGKWYISADKSRMETTIERNGHSRSTIVIGRMDKNIEWLLNPKTNTYIEKDSQAERNDAKKPVGQLAGTETIDGQLADRYDSNTGTGSQVSYYIHGTTVPLKSITDMTVSGMQVNNVFEYKNIQIGEPSPDMFEIPEGYTKKRLSHLTRYEFNDGRKNEIFKFPKMFPAGVY